MFDRIFANFLLEQGKLTEQSLNEIFDIQDSKRVRLGVIAVSEKLMTIEQVEEVNQLQAILDKRFGDIAIEKGYLNSEQVGRLLVLQGNSYLAFVQSAIDGGYITMDEIEQQLVKYQEVNNFTLSNIEDLKSCDINRIIPIFLYSQPELIRELAGVIVRTIVRLVDFHAYIKKPSVVSEYDYREEYEDAKFGKVNVTVFKNPIEIIEKRYGSNWRTPIDDHRSEAMSFFKE